MAKEKEYRIRIHNTFVTVTRDVYQAYYREERRMKTLDEKDIRNGKVSVEAMDTEETLGIEMIPDTGSPSVEDAAIASVLKKELRRAIAEMQPEDRELITTLYFKGVSERQLSALTGIPQKTINNRRKKAIDALRSKFFEKN